MLQTIVVLPDGTEVSSGISNGNVVQSCTYTECVNGGTELILGSVCSAMVEIKFLTPGGDLDITAGDELTVYKYDGNTRRKLGIFIAEKPTRPSANTMKLTAYDRVSKLDKDMTAWLASLKAWPRPLHGFVQGVCSACGVNFITLLSDTPNGGYLIPQFSAEGITGRQLVQWALQATGRFARATVNGDIELAWYTTADKSIGPMEDANTIFYYGGGLTFEDFVIDPIEKVQIHQNEEDVGVIWPNSASAVNTYQITGNPLLTNPNSTYLQTIAKSLYEQLQQVRYTPCKVSIPATFDIRAGNIVNITDKNGREITAYVMTKTQTGQKDTIECTGSIRRDSVSAVNEQSFKALSGKVMNIRSDVDMLRIENADTNGNVTSLTLDINSIRTSVANQSQDVDGIKSEISSIKQEAGQVRIDIESIQNNGVSKVKTGASYTFDDDGLRIARQGERIENLLDNTGMYVTRSGEVLLQANSDGVEATDVKVNNYLIIGQNARFEDYQTNRTACFYVGG